MSDFLATLLALCFLLAAITFLFVTAEAMADAAIIAMRVAIKKRRKGR